MRELTYTEALLEAFRCDDVACPASPACAGLCPGRAHPVQSGHGAVLSARQGGDYPGHTESTGLIAIPSRLLED